MHPTLIGPSSAKPNGAAERARRTTCLIGAYVSHPTLPSGLNVIVKDTSLSGAKLEVASAKGNAFAASTERVPDRFTLVMPMDRTMVECRIAWRKGNMMGVRYLGPATQLPKRQNEHLKQSKAPKPGFISQVIKQLG
jgi:hypothetical protein